MTLNCSNDHSGCTSGVSIGVQWMARIDKAALFFHILALIFFGAALATCDWLSAAHLPLGSPQNLIQKSGSIKPCEFHNLVA